MIEHDRHPILRSPDDLWRGGSALKKGKLVTHPETRRTEKILFHGLEDPNIPKEVITFGIADTLRANLEHRYKVVEVDSGKPWGAYLRFDDRDTESFREHFFPDLAKTDKGSEHLTQVPTILIVDIGAELPLQRHRRRNEHWRVVSGTPLITMDQSIRTYGEDALISIQQGQIHQVAVGAQDTRRSVIAKIWEHTDSNKPSDDEDIELISAKKGHQ